MPWNCSICAAFAADDINKILNHIGRSHRNDPNFHCICGIDGCAITFKKYYSWRKHVRLKHANVQDANRPNANQAQLINDDQLAIPNNLNMEDIAPSLDVQNQVKRSSALYLLKLQEDCNLPKSTVKSVVANTKTVVQETLSIVKTQVKQRLAENEIDFETIPGLNEIFEENNAASNPFNMLETETQQMAYFKNEFNLKKPQRIALGQKEVYRRKKGVLQQTNSHDEFCYVSILDSLEQLLNDEFVLEQVENPHRSTDGKIRDYCDGMKFQNHPLFSTDPQALQVMLYYDDLETCNPLGSRATKHKLGAFYYTLGNIAPMYRSSGKAIQLLCLCKTSHIKKYGIDAILKPFIADLKKLEQNSGHSFLINGNVRNFRGSIAYASGDNPGSHLLGGFKEGCQAHRMCRHCLGLDEDIRSKFHEKYFNLRTEQNYDDQCGQVLAFGEYFSKTYGINRQSILNESRYFHVVGGLPTDAMHDILEGVLHYEMKEMLKVFIKVHGFFSLEELNSRIARFDLGYYNDKNKPSPITEKKLSSNDNSLKQHAVQMWCLATHLPLIIGDLVPEDNANWDLFLTLLDITSICFSPTLSSEQIAYLQVLIEDHHSEFCNIYPDCSIIPKMHFMIHMPSVILQLGPLVGSWCMRYEAKHHYFKKLSTIIGNFTNLPYSLSMRHQQWMCYKSNSSGNFKSSFLEKGIEVGSGPSASAGDLTYYQALKQEHEALEGTTNVTKPKWISVQGTIYKVGCVVWIGHDEEEMPIFHIVREICMVERSLEYIWFVTEALLTVSFCKHKHAYEVRPKDDIQVLLKQDNLVYYLPLHLISGEQGKNYICPKFQVPV